MFSRLKEDVASVFDRDPAARNMWEVVTCYPGFHALVIHRFSHWLWGAGLNQSPRPGGFIRDRCLCMDGLIIHAQTTIRTDGFSSVQGFARTHAVFAKTCALRARLRFLYGYTPSVQKTEF